MKIKSQLFELFDNFYTCVHVYYDGSLNPKADDPLSIAKIQFERNLAEARVSLAEATKIVLKNGLSILGVNAPEHM